MAANVETMFSVREKPWHGLGTIVAEAPTSADALKLAGLDWNVVQEPIFTDFNEPVEATKQMSVTATGKCLEWCLTAIKWCRIRMLSVSRMNCLERVSGMRLPGHYRRVKRYGCSQDFRGNTSLQGNASARIWYSPIHMTVPVL